MLDAVLERWVEDQPGARRDYDDDGGGVDVVREGERVVVEVVKRLVELEGMDR